MDVLVGCDERLLQVSICVQESNLFYMKNDYFKIINESELMGFGRRIFISGYRDEYDFMFII